MELTVKQRRTIFFGLLGVAVAAFIAALAATVLVLPGAGTILVIALVLVGLALVGEIVLLVWGETKEFDEKGDWYEWESETDAGEELLLRCASCKNVFSIMDDGRRPLKHACPKCGRVGVLRDNAGAAGGGAPKAPSS